MSIRQLPLPPTSLLLAVLTAAAFMPAQGQAQDTTAEIRKLADKLDAVQAELQKSAERERLLTTRLAAIEGELATVKTKSEADAADSRRTALEREVDDAVTRIQSVEQSAGAGSRLAVGGYFDLEFRDDHGADHRTFDQHRLVLKFDGDIAPWISFQSELEIEGGGFDDFLTDNALSLESGELHFHFSPEFNVKAGVLLVPFGRFNSLHDAPLQDLTDRPLVETYVVPTTWSEAGVGIYGGHHFGAVGLDWDFIVSNGLDGDFDPIPGGGFEDARPSLRQDNNNSKQVTGRLGLTVDTPFFDTCGIGGSLAIGDYDARDRRLLTMLGADLTLRKGPFELVGEYVTANLERGPEEIAAGVPGGASGWYAEARWHFFPDAWRGACVLFNNESTFTLVFRADSADTDDSARGIDRATRGNAMRDDLLRYTIGFNFRPIEKTVVKLEYQFITEPSSVEGVDNNRLVLSFATYF